MLHSLFATHDTSPDALNMSGGTTTLVSNVNTLNAARAPAGLQSKSSCISTSLSLSPELEMVLPLSISQPASSLHAAIPRLQTDYRLKLAIFAERIRHLFDCENSTVQLGQVYLANQWHILDAIETRSGYAFSPALVLLRLFSGQCCSDPSLLAPAKVAL